MTWRHGHPRSPEASPSAPGCSYSQKRPKSCLVSQRLCGAGLVLGPAGSRPALYASLCLLFGRIPGNSAPGTTNLWNSSHNKLGGRKAHTHMSTVKCGYASPFPAVSLFVLLSFLPPVRALLCGRLPHTAPLVLPARPRADKTTLLLSRHHTHTLLGGGVRHATRTSRDLVLLARYNEHRPAKQQELRSEVNARSGRHEFDRAVVAIHTHK